MSCQYVNALHSRISVILFDDILFTNQLIDISIYIYRDLQTYVCHVNFVQITIPVSLEKHKNT